MKILILANLPVTVTTSVNAGLKSNTYTVTEYKSRRRLEFDSTQLTEVVWFGSDGHRACSESITAFT